MKSQNIEEVQKMYKIGFLSEEKDAAAVPAVTADVPQSNAPRRSVVQVSFPGNGKSLAYYNDSFDLREGDAVYVSGKLAGCRGRVEEVQYNFKIRTSDYQRVIAVVDTRVHGEFFFAGSHFVTFDANALPPQKARSWFLAPGEEEEDFVSGYDDTAFSLDRLGDMDVSPQIGGRGQEYYAQNRVRYLSVYGTHGYAIVVGSEPYEVEFEMEDGMIRNLVCSCYCSYNCKHEVAAMLQLRETMDLITGQYAQRYAASGCFAAILKSTFFSVAVDGSESGSICL